MANFGQDSRRKKVDLVYQTIKRHPNGISEKEIATELTFNPRTVHNYLVVLETEGKIYKETPGKYWYPLPYRSIQLRPIELETEEAVTLYLAARLLVKQQDKKNTSAQLALTRLSEALAEVGVVENDIYQASLELAQGVDDEVYSQIFRTIVQSYIHRHKVEITYEPLYSPPFKTIFSPYLIEPSAIGFATYVIGHSKSEFVDDLRTYKIQRMIDAKPLRDEYTMPSDFKGLDILRSAWSIIHSDKEIPVKLRFSPKVAKRVRESHWHQSQGPVENDPDNPEWVIWTAKVADLTDFIPWVRSWGADCEVIAPDILREEMKKMTTRLGKLYQVTTKTTKLLYHLPYAKTNREAPDEIHLLLYHLIDVGQVARLIWDEVLTDSIRQRLANILRLDSKQTGQLIAFLAALHDLGKAGPAYQKKYGPKWLKKALQEAGLKLHSPSGKTAFDKTTPHATISTWVLQDFLPEYLGLEKRFAQKIAVALGGHHGVWPGSGATWRLELESEAWKTLRRDLFREVQAVFQPPTAVSSPTDKTDLNIFLTIFSGLVSVADWLGSRNEECFGFVEQAMPTQQYALHSAQKARQSLADLGWFGWNPTGQTLEFGEVFNYLNFKAPRGVQTEVIKAAQNLPAPSLLILEAPTGIGKTEAALYLADHWLQEQAGRGLYVAMPTQATSNQMYDRIGKFLKHRYPEAKINYHLVHGQAAWRDTLKTSVELQTVGDDERGDAIQAESWFTPRKRTLLAPFGVGTVDQTFMSVLQTKHFFVRLFGLSHKVIIFDEVHAYDTFMNTLFERLLAWLNAVGTSVIILSATLPTETRKRLIEAYSGHTLTQKDTYPCLTIAAPNREPTCIDLPKPDEVKVQLAWDLGRAAQDILDYLKQALVDGGCAAVLCNTVRRAQAVYCVLDEARQTGDLDIAKDDLILFHARFPPVWRTDIEAKVSKKFGKPYEQGQSPHRPGRAIVVATQVIEQSLDLDFDLMLTDMAPIDLMVQRAGRLHRHARSVEERYGLERRLVITEPDKTDGLPKFEADEYVYARYVLLRSFYALQAKGNAMTLPTDTSSLIEQVYGDLSLLKGLTEEQMETIRIAETKMKRTEKRAQNKARQQLVHVPTSEALLDSRQQILEEESPDNHETMRALTRDIPPSISIICLYQFSEEIFLEPNTDSEKIVLDKEPSYQLAQALAKRAITITTWPVVKYLSSRESLWKKNSLLCHYKLILFENQQYPLPEIGYTLRLTREYGLEIIKEEK